MHSKERDEILAFLTGSSPNAASSRQIAAAVASAFLGIGQALTPIVGERGLDALYKRSLHLAGGAYSWLAIETQSVPVAMDIAVLKAALEEQAAADAAAAGVLLLQTFHQLLSTLVGSALTEQLLRPVWVTFLSGPSAKHTTS